MCKERSYDEIDAAIEDLLGKYLTLREEVKKLKREHEIQSIRVCEVMEQKRKAKDDKIFLSEQQLSLQQVDIINQLYYTNQELFNLTTKKERVQNDLNT